MVGESMRVAGRGMEGREVNGERRGREGWIRFVASLLAVRKMDRRM